MALKLGDIDKAIGYERQYQYIDVQGRKKPFSQFVSHSLRQLEEVGPQWPDKLGTVHTDLKTRFKRYGTKAVAQRMGDVDRLSAWTEACHQWLKNPTQLERAPAETVQKATLLDQPLSVLTGIGPQMVKKLASLGLLTVGELLKHYPRRYVDYQQRRPMGELTPGESVTLIGTIRSVSAYQAKRRNLWIVTVTVADGTGRLLATWFFAKTNQQRVHQFKNQFEKGADILLSGQVKWDAYKESFAMDRPEVEVLHAEETEPSGKQSLHMNRIVPVYSLGEGVHLKGFRRVIHSALQAVSHQLTDPLLPSIQDKYHLIDWPTAASQIHFPDSLDQAEAARRRIAFDEFFFLQARLALVRKNYKQTIAGRSLTQQAGGYSQQFLTQLPFSLTNAQQRVFQEILTDFQKPEPMYRLLQGDVGSGKTVVALLALLVGVENGYQGALMVPTEILAEQHYKNMVKWLTPLGLKAGLVLGKAGKKQREATYQGLLNGQIHIAVGTHALIQDQVQFNQLGVVVIDEQHRFGVRQRMLLKEKGSQPEMLTMTATPIPRTLAMTLHGDLEVSLLDERPPGRMPIQTVLITRGKMKQVYEQIRLEVVQGRQAYIVFPLIEESETLSAKAATTEAERLQTDVFPNLRVGLIHGKLKPDEKEAVMADFAAGQIHILVSTTVVEVGVDVPNATIMIIEDADRFGLSQLHQLRGRIGRGQHASTCLLVSQSKTPETLERLKLMTETDDGFMLSEKDLALRGPGEFLGTRQSGLPAFLLANLVEDSDILEQAREAAFNLIESGDELEPAITDLIYEKTDETMCVLGSG